MAPFPRGQFSEAGSKRVLLHGCTINEVQKCGHSASYASATAEINYPHPHLIQQRLDLPVTTSATASINVAFVFDHIHLATEPTEGNILQRALRDIIFQHPPRPRTIISSYPSLNRGSISPSSPLPWPQSTPPSFSTASLQTRRGGNRSCFMALGMSHWFF